MEPNRDPPPFWSPPPSIHRRRSSSPPFISLPALIVLLPTLALILLFFAIGPLLSLTSQLFRPTSVKKSWDSFNVFLVFFAIICGIFVRRNDDMPIAVADVGNSRDSDQRTVSFYDSARRTPGTAAVVTRRLRKNSSYPDLRQESPWGTGNEVNQFRFFDDFEVNRFRSRSSFANRTRGNEIEESPAEIQVNPAVSFQTQSSPPPVPQRKSRRTYQTIQKEEEVREVIVNKAEFAKFLSPPPPPPLPQRTVIPPSPVRVRLEEKFGKSGRKKTNVKKEIAMALGLLYRKRKKKQKAINMDDGHHRSPPPSPPPPPPPSLFRGLFKKSNKNKRVHSESAPPPPPPPPPAPFSSRSTNKKIQTPSPPSPPPSSWQRNSSANRRPPLPARVPNSSIENEGINIGGWSPSVTIPPPPPPPPLTDMESVGRGDPVGSQSSETSHYGSQKPVNIEPSSDKELTDNPGEASGGGGGVGPVFCPSPDVNIKATDFIARRRGEWRLEKMNSVRQKERLGQGPKQEIMMGLGPEV